MPDDGPITDTARCPDPADRLRAEWTQGRRPDVDAFLARLGPVPPAEAFAVLRADQRERWRAGERVPAEDYLARHPAVQADAEAAVDLIFNEFLLREQLGEAPPAAEYLTRFPEHAATLGPQIGLHAALAAGASGSQTVTPAGTDPGLPEAFGPYRRVRPLGRGSMGEVYLVHDTRLGREVALKVMRFAPDDAAAVARFRREARIAAALDHPHLCPIFDVGDFGGTPYLTMPVVRGEPLADRLRRAGPLPPAEAARLAAQVARAVEVAHRAGVVHRDLKPSNVMLADRGPVVMDFGLARRSAADDPRVTSSGTVAGTPAYLAPERIGGEAEPPDPRGDVYSLGVMLYEMLTGTLPFRGTVGETLRRALTEPPPPPSGIRRGLDPRLEAVCLRAMVKDPGGRFPTMAAFADALDACLGPAARRPSRTWPAGAAAVLSLVLVAGLGGAAGLALWHWGGRQGPAEDGRVKETPAPPGAGGPGEEKNGRPEGMADGFARGDHWVGRYTFDDTSSGATWLEITDRQGEVFRGDYYCAPGPVGWRVKGSIKAGKVRWVFTAVIGAAEPGRELIEDENGLVQGTIAEDTLTAEFYDKRGNDHARLVLRRKK